MCIRDRAYGTWGGYGASKAALEQLSAVLAVEEEALRVWWVDPGDMRTDLYAAAEPGEDLAGRALPESVAPAFLRLLDERPASGRYTASDLLDTASALPDSASVPLASAPPLHGDGAAGAENKRTGGGPARAENERSAASGGQAATEGEASGPDGGQAGAGGGAAGPAAGVGRGGEHGGGRGGGRGGEREAGR